MKAKLNLFTTILTNKIKLWSWSLLLIGCTPKIGQVSQVSMTSESKKLLDELGTAIEETLVAERLLEKPQNEKIYYICFKIHSDDPDHSDKNPIVSYYRLGFNKADQFKTEVAVDPRESDGWPIGRGYEHDWTSVDDFKYFGLALPVAKLILEACTGSIQDKKIAPLLMKFLNKRIPEGPDWPETPPDSPKTQTHPQEFPRLCKPIKAFQTMGLDPNKKLDITSLNQRRNELLLRNHPDKVGNSEEANRKTQEIVEAHKTLVTWLGRQ
jgi:hypothetical protein